MCEWYDVFCHVEENVINPIQDTVFGAVAEQAMSSFNSTLIAYGAAWTNLPTVSFSATSGASGFVFNQLHYWQFVVAVIATIIAGIKITLDNDAARSTREFIRMFFLMILTSSSAVAIIGLLVTVADLTAASIISSVSSTGLLDLTTLFKITVIPGAASVSATFLLIIGIAGLVANVIQIGILLMRSAMMVLLTGFLPISAAVSNLSWGRDWFNKNIAWLVAFIIYKPVAALIYGFGITLLGSNQKTIGDSITSMALGMIVLLMSIFALPALIKFLTPAVAAIGAGGGGAGMGMAYLASGFTRGGGGSDAPPSGASSSSTQVVQTPGGSSSRTDVGVVSSRTTNVNAGSAGASSSAGASGVAGSAGVGASGAGVAAGGASSAASAGGAAAGAATGGATIIAAKTVEGINQVAKNVSGAVESETDSPGGAL